MNVNKQIQRDYKKCIRKIEFWKKAKKEKLYKEIFSLSEIEEIINYYKDMKKYLEREIKND